MVKHYNSVKVNMPPLKMQMQVKANDQIMNSGQNQEEEEVAKSVKLLISVLGLCLQT